MKPAKLCNQNTIIGPIIYPMATEPLLEISIRIATAALLELVAYNIV